MPGAPLCPEGTVPGGQNSTAVDICDSHLKRMSTSQRSYSAVFSSPVLPTLPTAVINTLALFVDVTSQASAILLSTEVKLAVDSDDETQTDHLIMIHHNSLPGSTPLTRQWLPESTYYRRIYGLSCRASLFWQWPPCLRDPSHIFKCSYTPVCDDCAILSYFKFLGLLRPSRRLMQPM